ncbi:MAG: hypothetical protein F4Z41_02625 [Acidimicrobiia bacterium]|nr:hypothetical protein [bacterium]MXX45081.1 hypothetical protein [Acidimicrobiia bacterium]MDE0673959.1 hypothetical protein [bacterium]MXY75300.1 hypothetical protein [Acidimicrobiia bacterium]MYA39855.1 hypothetical protein [Acidimicrobiia bacterium]
MITIRRAVEAAFLKKDSLAGIALDHRATADAALLVSGVALVGYVWELVGGERFSWRLLVAIMINSVMVWVIIAGVTLLAGRVLCRTETPMFTIMRLQGFCHLPLLLVYLVAPLAWFGRIWFLAAMVVATAEALETVWWRAALAVLAGLMGMFFITQLFWGARAF